MTRFRLVAESVRAHLCTLPHQPERASALRRTLAEGGVPDYATEAVPYTQAFWERNFWKAAYFFGYEFLEPSLLMNSCLAPDGYLEAMVLGAGSGADTVACMAWLDGLLPLHKIRLTLMDSDPGQLALARGIISRAQGCLDRAIFDIRFVCCRLETWEPRPASADLILMGHLLTENPLAIGQLAVKTVGALKPRGDLVIIERRRDPIWRAARERFALCGVTTHEVGLDDKFQMFLPLLPSGQADITPSYVKASMPSNKSLQTLVGRYFQAWLDRSSDTLGDIFTPDATYDEKPGIEPVIVGLDGIRRYWDAHPGQQSSIRLTVHNVAYSDSVSVCSWSGEFDTGRQHITIRGAMNFFFDLYRGKINRFDELFGTTKTPLDA